MTSSSHNKGKRKSTHTGDHPDDSSERLSVNSDEEDRFQPSRSTHQLKKAKLDDSAKERSSKQERKEKKERRRQEGEAEKARERKRKGKAKRLESTSESESDPQSHSIPPYATTPFASAPEATRSRLGFPFLQKGPQVSSAAGPSGIAAKDASSKTSNKKKNATEAKIGSFGHNSLVCECAT
jgi:hypothetical protein